MYLGTFDLDDAATAFAAQSAAGDGILRRPIRSSVPASPRSWASASSDGPMGKSASSRCMSVGPTRWPARRPVSALIHAATMVAAGVYLVARVFGC